MIRRILEIRWGEKSMLLLYLSVLSGIALSLQYDHTASYYSVNTIDLVVPYGAFCRSLHFYSSQLFFLFALAHLAVIIYERGYERLGMYRWVLLVLTVPVTLLLLFTGYVLRGDGTGESAGFIAENISLSLPVAGEWVNNLLFAIRENGLKRVYANHLIGLGVVWGILSWDHVRRYRVKWMEHGRLLVLVLLFCIFVPAPMEPYVAGATLITGPWFFIGLQEALRYVQPFWAGIFFPLTPLVALIFIQRSGTSGSRREYGMVIGYISAWLILYAVLTFLGYLK
jgi:ubiquinol-cytochrome c reductase cytochrome b subunit